MTERNLIEDEYQGIPTTQLTDRQARLAALILDIASIEESAQDAEDREQYGRASALRAKARSMNAELQTLRAER